MPYRSGWRMEQGHAEKELNYEEIKAKAKDLLEKVAKGDAWRSRCGSLHIPLLMEGEVVGELREDAEVKELEIGAYRYGGRGIKVQLVKDGKAVGFLWLPPHER